MTKIDEHDLGRRRVVPRQHALRPTLLATVSIASAALALARRLRSGPARA